MSHSRAKREHACLWSACFLCSYPVQHTGNGAPYFQASTKVIKTVPTETVPTETVPTGICVETPLPQVALGYVGLTNELAITMTRKVLQM